MRATLRTLCLAGLAASALSAAPGHNDTTAVAAAAGPAGGAMLEFSQKFTQFMLDTFIPELDNMIMTTALPDQSGRASGFDYHIQAMKIKSVDLTSATIKFRESQGLEIAIPLHIEVDGRWSYKLHSIPHIPKGSGAFTASAGGSSHISTVLTIGASGGNPTIGAANVSSRLLTLVPTIT